MTRSQEKPVPGVRYVAEWVTKQFFDKDGEWQPDRDDHESSYHDTLKAAQTAAMKSAKRANIADWARVTRELDGPCGWEEDETRAWVGDQRGNWDEVRA